MQLTINTTDDLDTVLNRIDFEPSCLDMGWQWHKEAVFSAGGNCIGWNLWTTFRRPDTNTGKVGTGPGRKWFIARGATESGVVKTCFSACKMILEHELMEMFLYEGTKVFDPHHELEDLRMAALSKERRKS